MQHFYLRRGRIGNVHQHIAQPSRVLTRAVKLSIGFTIGFHNHGEGRVIVKPMDHFTALVLTKSFI